ncbi:MAG: DNA-directed RNA polymerase [Candidatus Diapherotrites archaeon]
MYSIVKVRDTIRVSPNKFSSNLNNSILSIVRGDLEGLIDHELGVIVAVMEAASLGEGKIVPGDASAYFDSEVTLLVYKPQVNEVVEGIVSEATEFGAFVKTGPIEGLVHVSQIADDFISFDAKLPGFVGRDSRRTLKIGDTVTAKVVSVSMKGTIPDSKIGLTMRQPGLGKKEWAKIKKVTRAPAGKKAPPKGGDVE